LATGYGQELYPTVTAKAATLLHSLARTQAFHDGNKRTAWACCTAYLRQHGSPISSAVTQAEVVEFVVAVAVGEVSVDAIALQLIEWLE
jgi:death-on-curing protein